VPSADLVTWVLTPPPLGQVVAAARAINDKSTMGTNPIAICWFLACRSRRNSALAGRGRRPARGLVYFLDQVLAQARLTTTRFGLPWLRMRYPCYSSSGLYIPACELSFLSQWLISLTDHLRLLVRASHSLDHLSAQCDEPRNFVQYRARLACS
jgi:hypothetical protein